MLPRNRRATAALLVTAVLVGLWYLFVREPSYRGLIRPAGRALVFAHRGFGNYAPDNSLAGALLAMQAGMDGVDMDGQLSADGELVIFHDLSVDRLTDGTGRVNSKTLRELLALDLGPKYGHGFKHAFVATFDDFVRSIKGKGILMVELKVPGLRNTGIEQRAVAIIQKYHAQDSVYLSSFNPLVLYRLKKLQQILGSDLPGFFNPLLSTTVFFVCCGMRRRFSICADVTLRRFGIPRRERTMWHVEHSTGEFRLCRNRVARRLAELLNAEEIERGGHDGDQ